MPLINTKPTHISYRKKYPKKVIFN